MESAFIDEALEHANLERFVAQNRLCDCETAARFEYAEQLAHRGRLVFHIRQNGAHRGGVDGSIGDILKPLGRAVNESALPADTETARGRFGMLQQRPRNIRHHHVERRTGALDRPEPNETVSRADVGQCHAWAQSNGIEHTVGVFRNFDTDVALMRAVIAMTLPENPCGPVIVSGSVRVQ
ncbi:MAG: hypothetical protein V4793_21665 [Paraburkholderia tropica]